MRGNSPVEQAAAVYRREPCARTFREDLEFYLINGWVVSTPTVFAMARPVASGASYQQITGHHVFPMTEADAWLIYLLAGSMADAWHYLPFDLPKVMLERGNVLRSYDLFAFRKRSTSRSP